VTKSSVLKAIVAPTVIIFALLQWLIILERSVAALWAWYQFHGYGGGGTITLGVRSQVTFYFLTVVISALGFWFSWTVSDNNRDRSGFLNRAAGVAAVAMIAGMFLWSGLLLSPLVSFR
jgi:hypothetical protein